MRLSEKNAVLSQPDWENIVKCNVTDPPVLAGVIDVTCLQVWYVFLWLRPRKDVSRSRDKSGA
jgi:hypothetical protein